MWTDPILNRPRSWNELSRGAAPGQPSARQEVRHQFRTLGKSPVMRTPPALIALIALTGENVEKWTSGGGRSTLGANCANCAIPSLLRHGPHHMGETAKQRCGNRGNCANLKDPTKTGVGRFDDFDGANRGNCANLVACRVSTSVIRVKFRRRGGTGLAGTDAHRLPTRMTRCFQGGSPWMSCQPHPTTLF